MNKKELIKEFEKLQKELHDKILEYEREINPYKEKNLCLELELEFELHCAHPWGNMYSGRDGFHKKCEWGDSDRDSKGTKYFKTGYCVKINFQTEEILEDDEPFEDGSPAFHFENRGGFRMIRDDEKKTSFNAWEVPEDVCSEEKATMFFFQVFSKFIDDKNPMMDFFNEKFDKLIELDKQIMDCQ